MYIFNQAVSSPVTERIMTVLGTQEFRNDPERSLLKIPTTNEKDGSLDLVNKEAVQFIAIFLIFNNDIFKDNNEIGCDIKGLNRLKSVPSEDARLAASMGHIQNLITKMHPGRPEISDDAEVEKRLYMTIRAKLIKIKNLANIDY